MGKEANELKKSILNYCIPKGHLISPINNAPTRKHKNTVRKGTPDLLGITNKGIGLAIEIKTKNDRQSEEQKEYERLFKLKGGIYIIAESLDDLIKAGL